MSKIGILIPCYNVQVSIQSVLSSFSDDVLKDIDTVLAIDNCSVDNTLHTLNKIKLSESNVGKKLVIIKNSQNYGLGGSQKIGYRYFIENNFTHFMIIHGDNQGDANDISKNFLKYFNDNPNIDLIYASRFVEKSNTLQYNFLRRVGNIFFNNLTQILTGYKMSDSGCGIIFYRTEILKRVAFSCLTNSSQFNPELNILLYSFKDLTIVEIPLNWKDSIEESHISGLKYSIILFRILINYRINKWVFNKSSWELFRKEPQRIDPDFTVIS